MNHEEICTYEVCKLAQEKGFPQDVFGSYEMKSSCYLKDGRYYKDGCICPIEEAYTTPTQSILQRWLREEKGVHIVIESEPTTTTSSNMLFQWIINYNSDGECYDCYNDIRAYPSYEKTLESALKFTLENLI